MNNQNIRNIGIMAHIDAGKTTTTERILFYTGTIHKMGEVHDGNTTMDWMEQEQERGITITSAVTTCFWKKTQINIIDTPGHVDFTAEVERSLRVLDGAIAIFCGVGGVEPQSETVWAQSEKYKIPKIAYINKLDRTGASFDLAIEMIRDRLTKKAIPLQIPIGKESNFIGIIDLVLQKAYFFDQNIYGSQMIEKPIPSQYLQKTQTYRDLLLEELSEYDDELLEMVLDNAEIPTSKIVHITRLATINMNIVPVFCGSSLKNIGVRLLLNAVNNFLPSPCDIPKIEVLNDSKRDFLDEDSSKIVALAYKMQIDKHVGKMMFVRVYSGTIKKGATLFNQTSKKKEKITRILQMHSNKTKDVTQVSVGDIATLVGTKFTKTGDTLTSIGSNISLSKMSFPETVISLIIEPLTKADQKRLLISLKKLEEEDPTFSVRQDENSGQTVISGMGELHLEVLIYRLKSEFGVKANVGSPQVAYRETIVNSAKAKETFEPELASKSNFAEVEVRVSPIMDSKDKRTNIFKNSIAPDVIPSEFFSAIKQGAMNSLSAGPLLCLPVKNVLVEILGGAFRQADSTQTAFSIAASTAVSKALQKAKANFLEPIVKVVVLSPNEYLGDIIGDLNSKRGKVLEIKSLGNRQEIFAEAPVSELFGYATKLRNLSKGRAVFSSEFLKYEEVPKKIFDEILKKSRGY